MLHRTDTAAESSLLNPLLVPLHFSVLILSLWVPPFPGRKELSVALILATYIPTLLAPVSDDPAIAFGVASLWGFTLRLLTIHLFSYPDPEQAYYRTGGTWKEGGKGGDGKGDANREDVRAYGMGLLKLQWLLSLVMSPRGLGWNCQGQMPPPLPLLPTHTSGRRAYVKYALKRLLLLYLALDLCRTYDFVDPIRFMITDQDPQFWTLADPYNLDASTVINAAVHGIASRCFIDMQYMLISILFIFIGGQDPSEWRPFFGSLTDAYRLSYFWGRVWHQALRGIFIPWGDAICKVLRVKHKVVVLLVRVVIGSILSALGHASAVYSGTRGRHWWDTFWFFSIQAVGVIFEITVCELYGRLTGENLKRIKKTAEKANGKLLRDSSGLSWGKAVGYIWVAVWLLYTSQWMMADVQRVGLAQVNPVPWSVVRWVLKWPQTAQEVL